jgi:MtN3 and saliva related transmembrane protein
MELTFAEYIGLTAGALTTAAYLPQVYKTWRTKAVGDISLIMYWAMTLGVFLWLVYGVLLRAPALVLANGVSLLLVGGMLRMRIVYGRRTDRTDTSGTPHRTTPPQ